MQIIGVDYIKFEPFTMVGDLGELANAKNPIFDFDEAFLREAKGDFGVICHDENEILLANGAGARFVILNNENLIKWAVKMAEFYMFDAKISLIIKSPKDLKICADLGVDCVILASAIEEI